MKKNKIITILTDTREQMPLDFSPFGDVATEPSETLWPGDYTIKGFEKSIAFERKSVSDLIGTMKTGYVGKDSIRRYESRFDQELEEFERHYDRAFVIVEPDSRDKLWPFAERDYPPERVAEAVCACSASDQLARGWYRAQIPPSVLRAFIRALTVDYGCHVYLAASREDAANEIVEIARRYVKARRHVIHRQKIAKEQTPKTDECPW